MKTVALRSQDSSINVEVKVDIFATVDQLQQPGFDTRFTGMEIKDDFNSIASGVNVTEIEHNWQSLIFLAQSLGLGLYVSDLNGDTQSEIEIVEPASVILTRFAATSLSGDACTTPNLGALDAVYFHDGQGTVPVVGDTIYQDVLGETPLASVGAANDHIQLGNGQYLQTDVNGVFTTIVC